MPKCHFLHDNSHIKYPRIEHGPVAYLPKGNLRKTPNTHNSFQLGTIVVILEFITRNVAEEYPTWNTLKRKVNWIGHILRRNCLLRQVIEGKIKGGIEVTGRQRRIRRKLLDDLKERRGYSHLKKEALDRTMWRTRFARGFGPAVRQTTKWMNFVSARYDRKFLVPVTHCPLCPHSCQGQSNVQRISTVSIWYNSTSNHFNQRTQMCPE
jgi:hypothetical protein